MQVLCAIDKEGVLSHPMPSVEKVFVISELLDEVSRLGSTSSGSGGSMDSIDSAGHGHALAEEDTLSHISAEAGREAAVVLDVRFDGTCEYGIRFIDVDWRKLLPSLKPLGLNVLLNTACNQPWQALRLADHVRYLTLVQYGEIVAARKKCLCMLGKTIGFTDGAVAGFLQRQQIWTFAPQVPRARTDSDVANLHGEEGREGAARQYETTEREPVPHMVSHVIQDTRAGTLQLLTEGTPPFVLQHCVDVWDGQDVRPLGDDERKAIMDFYWQMSRRMMVVAFAYRPIADDQPWFDKGKPVAVTLPLETEDTGPEAAKARTCYDMQSGQVFIGMVGAQRQPRDTLVKMVDELSDGMPGRGARAVKERLAYVSLKHRQHYSRDTVCVLFVQGRHVEQG